MCQIVSRPAGSEARSPGLSVTVGPPRISMAASPSSTWIVSRSDGVHGVGPSTAVNRVRPAHTPSAWTNSCISLPGTSGSDCHSEAFTLETNTPGCGSIADLLAATGLECLAVSPVLDVQGDVVDAELRRMRCERSRRARPQRHRRPRRLGEVKVVHQVSQD